MSAPETRLYLPGSCTVNMEIGTAWFCTGKHFPQCLWDLRILDSKSVNELPYNVTICNIKMSCPRSSHWLRVFSSKHRRSQVFSKTYNLPVGLEESSETQTEGDPSNEEIASEDSPKELFAKPMSSDELKALSADTERAKLIRKLSEANQQNRFLKRQLQVKEDALINFKSELAVMELEVQALVALAEEISQSGIQEGSRKINGKYIQSHLLSRLEAVHGKLKEQIKDVDAAQSREVPLFWCGMAESVQVMGSFDGWSQGEHLSPEYDGSFTKFTAKLILRPGRYEIKFLVDGMWQLSPEYPTVGEGLTKNNLLVVE